MDKTVCISMQLLTTQPTAAHEHGFDRSTTHSANTSTREWISTINQPAFTEDFSNFECEHLTPCPFDGQIHHPTYCSKWLNSSLQEKKRLVSELFLLQLPWTTSKEVVPIKAHMQQTQSSSPYNSTWRTAITTITQIWFKTATEFNQPSCQPTILTINS